MAKTTFVLVTDKDYFYKANVTINDLRTIGSWHGDLVIISLDFNLDENYKNNNNIIEVKFPSIDKTSNLAIPAIGK